MYKKLILSAGFICLCGILYPQDFTLTEPRLNFNGINLGINYDIPAQKSSDKYFIWVEIRKNNGEMVQSRSFYGDVGPYVKAGRNKSIIWLPDDDSILIRKDFTIKIMGEKYIKAFNKGPVVLSSLLLPGLGQTKLKNGKPWWITGVVTYGLIGGGIVLKKSSTTNYDSYKIEENAAKRADLFDKAQSQSNTGTVMLLSGVSLWLINTVWIAAMPNNYKPLKHTEVTFSSLPGMKGSAFIGFKTSF